MVTLDHYKFLKNFLSVFPLVKRPEHALNWIQMTMTFELKDK